MVVKNHRFNIPFKKSDHLVLENGDQFLIKETASIYLISTQNNVIVTVKDLYSNVLFSKTGGSVSMMDFDRRHRSDSEVWKLLGSAVKETLFKDFKSIKNLCVYFRGFSSDRENFLKFLFGENEEFFSLVWMADFTRFPHNGCRSRKLRRYKLQRRLFRVFS